MIRGVALAIAFAACAARGAAPPSSGEGPDGADGLDGAGGPDGADEREPPIAGAEGDDDTAAVAPVGAAGDGTGAALLAEASRELAAMRTSVYSHRTRVDEAAGRFDYDCSGFLEYALARAAPDALRGLVDATVRRPLAKHVVGFLARGGGAGWRPLARADQLAPGDVIAWLEPAEVVSRNTGHVLIVRGPLRAGGGGVIIPIVDATSVRHGRGDSRVPTGATGLGTGQVVLLVDGAGAPVGYRWSLGRRAHPHTTTIALGRLAPPAR